MTSIVLSSYQRASIQFEKLATKETARLQDLNARGEISPNSDGNSVAYSATAKKLDENVSDLNFEISKAEKAIGALDATLTSIDKMKIAVERIQDLERAASLETDTKMTAAYLDQIDDLKEHIIDLGQGASFRGTNLFDGWGSQTTNIAGNTFSTTSVDLEDIIQGFAYRGGNVLGIEDGDFDTSAYSNLVAAYGPDVINDKYIDFTGNFQDATLGPSASIAQTGPGDIYGIDLPDTLSRNAGGSYAEIPDIELPEEFSLGVWFKFDEVVNKSRIFSMTNGGTTDLFHFNAYENNNMRVLYEATDGSLQTTDTPANSMTDDTFVYFMMTFKNTGEVAIYQDGQQIVAENNGVGMVTGERSEVYLAVGRNNTGVSSKGAMADFVIFNEALDENAAKGWYEDVALTGLEKRFYTMPSDRLEDAVQKLEAYYTNQKIAVESVQNQLIFRRELLEDNSDTLMSIDTEEVATKANIAQIRQTLAMTSLSIASQADSNILNLFR